uniref:Uncharacterized protein n=1 Tax=Ananas comosus var. bracteatus TaxID=296719 RepID=A0A6V7NH12_ANACO|nr:unnamed protein product [Ananas comosus var. bracteatus]
MVPIEFFEAHVEVEIEQAQQGDEVVDDEPDSHLCNHSKIQIYQWSHQRIPGILGGSLDLLRGFKVSGKFIPVLVGASLYVEVDAVQKLHRREDVKGTSHPRSYSRGTLGGARSYISPGVGNGAGQRQDRKRPVPDDGGQTSSRRPPRPPRSRSQGHRFSGASGLVGLIRSDSSRGLRSALFVVDRTGLDLVRRKRATPPSYGRAEEVVEPHKSKRQQHASSGSVYDAQIEDFTAADRVVAGIILIFDIRVHASFDTCASHSLVNRAYASLHGLEIRPLLHAREVQILDLILQVVECCWSCPGLLGLWSMPADRLVLGQLQDFDVVLNMDWLVRYYATIDGGATMVVFREPGRRSSLSEATRVSCLPLGSLQRELDR